MGTSVTRLYPSPPARLALDGLYLRHALRDRADAAAPCIYSNFIASLDGRIALADPARARRPIPAALRDPRDWRLYLELAAQADAVVISGRRWRELCRSRRRALDHAPGLARGDLARWRRARGLAPQPDCLVLSASLDLPLPGPAVGGRLIVLAGADAPSARVRRLRAAGVEVRLATGARVRGVDVRELARRRGYRTVYSAAGPQVLHTLVAARVLGRLYLTLALRLVGGADFDTLLHGGVLSPAADFRLLELHLAGAARRRAQLLFASLAPVPGGGE